MLIIMASVALAFAASAVAVARQHRLAGETLAFIGVLLHGNAIWLIAQVLHIRGNFPDAFMWWAIGALACAWLVGSRAIAVTAALLVFIWVVRRRSIFERPTISFVVVLVATMALAYKQKSPLVLGIAAAASDLVGVLVTRLGSTWSHLRRRRCADGLRLPYHRRVASDVGLDRAGAGK